MNEILKAERDKFFKKLKAARLARSTFETVAAIVIQARVRGHLTRLNLERILYRNGLVKQYRQRLRETLNKTASLPIPTLAEYRQIYARKRFNAALKIQLMFRRYVSKRLLARKKEEEKQAILNSKIIKLQVAGRKYNAKKRVDNIRKRKFLVLSRLAAIKIQAAARRYFARRRVNRRRYLFRFLAARVIQCFYRAILGRRRSNDKRATALQRKQQRGAMALQQLARTYIARLRTDRIAKRKKFLRTFRAATKIQKIVRAFTARRRVKRLRQSKLEERKEKERALAEDLRRKESEEAAALLEGSDIFIQAMKGHVTAVEDIFLGLVTDEKHDVAEVDANGDTILMIAACNAHMDIVRKCILWGFDINFRNENTAASVVAAAAHHKRFDVVQYLLNPPTPEPTATNKKPDKPALVWSSDDVAVVLTSVAAYSNNVGLMTTLIDLLGASSVECRHAETGESALHAACRGGVLDMVRLVVKSGSSAAFLAKDESGKSPYHSAAEASVDVIKLLTELDPNLPSGIQREAAIRSILMEPEANGKNCKLIAAIHGQEAFFNYFDSLDAGEGGENPAEPGEIGWSPLDIDSAISTAGQDKLMCIRYLIECGFDPSWANEDTGLTVLMESCRRGAVNVVGLLMQQQSVDFLQEDNTGRNSIHYCCMCTSDNMLSFVLSHEAATKCKLNGMVLASVDKKGYTPLHVAAEFGADLSVDLLAQDGIKVAIDMATTDEKLTPLMVAAKNYRIDTINRLVVLDANVKLTDANGRNVLWYLLQGAQQGGGNLLATTRLAVSSCGLELVRAGCPVVSSKHRTVQEYRQLRADYVKGVINKDKLDNIELIALDKNTSFIRSIAKLVTPEVCWRVGKFNY
jgi:ankyrin repeat protein